MTPWMYIVAGGLFETVWATTMKLSEGFTEPVWTVSTFVFLILSVVMLNKGLGELPMGSAYTVWVGMGAVGSIFVGIIFFSDSISVVKAILLIMIVAGVIGIERRSSKRPENDLEKMM